MRKSSLKIFFLLFLFNTFLKPQDVLLSPYASLDSKTGNKIVCLNISIDGKYIVSGDEQGSIKIFDLENRSIVSEFEAGRELIFTSFLKDNKSIVVVDKTGDVSFYDLLKGKLDNSFRVDAEPIKVTIDAGKKLLAVLTDDEKIQLYNLDASLPAGMIDASDKSDNALFLGFDRLAQQLLLITKRAEVVIWNPATQKLIRELSLGGGEMHNSRAIIHAASANRSSNIFAVSLEEVAIEKGGNGLVRRDILIAYDWNSGIEVKRVKLPWTGENLALGPGNDNVAISNEENKNVTIIDLRKGEMGSSVTAQDRTNVLFISEDDKWLASGSDNGKLNLWKMEYKGVSTALNSSLPSLSGRIRSISGTEPALEKGKPVKLAILKFEAQGVDNQLADVCLNSLASSLANISYITMVERRNIETILKEQQLQSSGLTEDQGFEVGKLLNADIVLTGNIGKIGNNIVISIRLLSVESGKILKGREVFCEECREQDIYDAINMLSGLIAN